MARRLRLLGLLAGVIGGLALAPAARAAGAPQVDDTWASGISATAADLRGLVNPGELETRAKIEYIPAAAYQANLGAAPPRDAFSGAIGSPVGGAPVGSGALAVQFTRHVGGLKAATAYVYRVVASNAEGTATGPARVFITQETTPAFALLDNRGWEMVSPADKNGGEIQGPGGNFGGGTLQASADGSAITYSSASSFAGGLGAPGSSQYTSHRGGSGWLTENITQPTLAGAYGTQPDGVPYQLFSDDLARGLLLLPERCQAAPCPRSYALRQSAGGALAFSAQATDLDFAGSNPELSQVVLATQGNLYRWAGGALTAVNLKPGEGAPTAGAELAAQSGAVSSDGSRVYFELEGNLYLRSGSQTTQVDDALGGGGEFQVASADGAFAFFTKGGHLYRYAVGGTATDLTPGGAVEGVLGISPDGSHAYYLTPAGLFLWRNGTTTAVAAVADASNYPPATGSARVAANGTLAFSSSASLTGADTGGFAQVYLHVPGAGLVCASCNPNGARPLGPSTIPGATANGTGPDATRMYKPRALSVAGSRLFFDSRDSLVVTDTNDDWDVYEWEAQGTGSCQRAGGCVALVSSGRSEGGASFVDASADGDAAFFLTDGSLVPTDPGAVDVYVARVGGGLPSPPVPIACLGDACQPIPGEPEDPGPSTSFYRGEANPPLSYPKAKKQKRKNGKKGKKRGKGKKSRAKKAGKAKGVRR